MRTAAYFSFAVAFACALALPPVARAHDALLHEREQAAAVQAGVAQPDESLYGIVDALVVEDRVDGRTLRFPRLRTLSGDVVTLVGAPADALRDGEAVRITGRRAGKALQVNSVEASDLVPAPRAKLLLSASGTLAVLHADDFEHGVSRFEYRIHGPGEVVTRLQVDTLPAMLRGGMTVEVEGYDAGAGVVPARIVVLTAPERATATRATVEKSTAVHSVLVVLANFSNTAAPGYTAAQAQQVMTTNANSVANFYAEASFGAHGFNVTVTPSWVTLSGYAQPSCIDTTLSTFTSAANAASKAAGYDPALYEFIVYLFPPTSGCGWAGLGYIGYPKLAYINGPSSFITQVVAHEMGHNFGLLHAASLRCTGMIGGTCSVSEYGDPFSTMGNQRAGHFNAAQKSLLGWIASGTTPTHPGGTVTYVLSPIESGGGTLYAVKVPTPNANRTYWIEFRQPIGFDAWTGWTSNGAQLRVASPFETYCSGCDGWSDDTELVDATPGTSSFNDAALLAGSTFSDPSYPVTISVLSATSTALTVQVSTPAAAGASTTTLSSSMNPAPVGATVTFTATVSGTSPTGTVAFRDGASTIAGCSAVSLAGSGNSRSALCSTSALIAGSHGITAVYAGDAGNTASTSASLSQLVNSAGWLGYLFGGNTASGPGSAVAAGSSNLASSQGAFIGAGTSNQATGVSSLVVGGFDNRATGIDSVVGAGAGNRATGARSVVVGGGYNLAAGDFSFIGGGGRDGTASTAAGTNTLDHIAGGKWATVGGGSGNRASNATTQTGAVVIGGEQNQALNTDATVAGGRSNVAGGTYATLAGGQGNLAGGSGASTGGGTSNAATALAATVPGGNSASASGSYAFAEGQRAKSTQSGAIALADASPYDFPSTAANQFSVRSVGGFRLSVGIDVAGIDVAGVTLPPGTGSWSSLSDRSAKQDLLPVDSAHVLERLVGMPAYTWRYRTERSGATHLGPTAQDFSRAFGLGASTTGIAMVDADGAALAAIQGLERELADKDALIAARAQRIAALRDRIRAVTAMQADVEAAARLLNTLLLERASGRPVLRASHR